MTTALACPASPAAPHCYRCGGTLPAWWTVQLCDSCLTAELHYLRGEHVRD